MKLSIVTPSFGQLEWLRLAVESVRDQVSDAAPSISVEHLIMDAGTDGIETFADARGASFARGGDEDTAVRAADEGYRLSVRSAPDRGMYDAINHGLRRATGDVCAYLNCDEQYLPGVLARVAAWFSDHPTADVLFCDAIVVDAQGAYVCDRRVTLPTRIHTLVSGNLAVFTSSTFFRRRVLQDGGLLFDPSFRAAGDAEWIARLLETGASLHTLRLRASIHTDTGKNLALSPTARAEAERLAATAPWWARRTRALAVLAHRLRRFRSGAYDLEPHRYAIYTRASPDARVERSVSRPTFRWRR